MITLGSFGIRFGRPEISRLVTKTRFRPRMACRKRPASPKRSLPYIGDGLGALRRALALALERIIEYYVDWALAGARWANPENFARGRAHCFDAAPE